MIPENFITKWGNKVDWRTPSMIEQDLIISRALVCLYNNPVIKDNLVFRGGTALNKLFLDPPARYSEDLDFVQLNPMPIGETINAIRDSLRDWLGVPKYKVTERSAKIIYPFESSEKISQKLKVEINITEHFQVLPLNTKTFEVDSEWFLGRAEIISYSLEELMATKLRALYQRRKGRDLFDTWYVFKNQKLNVQKVIAIFKKYCAHQGLAISRNLFLQNLEEKKLNEDFNTDMEFLLPKNIKWNFNEAFTFVIDEIILRI